MAVPFHSATAEQVVSAADAVGANGGKADAPFVEAFADLPSVQATKALDLACELGLLANSGGTYSTASPLCRFLATTALSAKAAALRVVLEDYEPFHFFRLRLAATASTTDAAKQTKARFDFSEHHEAIKDTLISLGTYTHALVAEGGGRYLPAEASSGNAMDDLLAGCADAAAAEAQVAIQLGDEAMAFVDRGEVVQPLANALLRASDDSRGAVVEAGNALESFLVGLASAAGVSLQGATGINSKIDKLSPAQIPKKQAAVGKYLGNVRNAADHGVDPDVNASWTIRYATGPEFVSVTCSFIAAATARHLRPNDPPEI